MVNTLFAGQRIWNNREMIAEWQSFIFKRRSGSILRRDSLSFQIQNSFNERQL